MYISVGSDVYFKAAVASALVFTRLNRHSNITVLCDRSDEEISYLCRDFAPEITFKQINVPYDCAFKSRHIKTLLYDLSPYDETLYLDSDIIAIKPVMDLWQNLEHHDLAMALDSRPLVSQCNHISAAELKYTLSLCCESAAQYNGGVLLWKRSSAAKKLFKRWAKEWQVFQKHDQLALVRALEYSGVKIKELHQRYNVSPKEFMPETWPGLDQVSLLHCWGGQVRSGAFLSKIRQLYPDVAAELQLRLPCT